MIDLHTQKNKDKEECFTGQNVKIIDILDLKESIDLLNEKNPHSSQKRKLNEQTEKNMKYTTVFFWGEWRKSIPL